MSAQAMHRVVLYGPDDPYLFRVLIVVADFADRDGAGAHVGQRVLAERVRVSVGRVRALLDEAVDGGWLVVDDPGGPRRRAGYNFGPALAAEAVTRETARAARGVTYQKRADTRGATYSKRAETLTVVNVSDDAARSRRRAASSLGTTPRRGSQVVNGKTTHLSGTGHLEDWTRHDPEEH